MKKILISIVILVVMLFSSCTNPTIRYEKVRPGIITYNHPPAYHAMELINDQVHDRIILKEVEGDTVTLVGLWTKDYYTHYYIIKSKNLNYEIYIDYSFIKELWQK